MKIAFVHTDTPESIEAAAALSQHYDSVTEADADTLVVLGGDGLVLETLHRHLSSDKRVYGMNRGSVGFLLNDYRPEALPDRLRAAHPVILKTLKMTAAACDGSHAEALALNEVSLLRESRQAAKIRVFVDGILRLPELICDGILLATPAGSTAYNLSAHGPILPIECRILALTPISAFRPRRWRGALLPQTAHVRFEILECDKRPVSAVADYTEIRNVSAVDITLDETHTPTLLFDPEQKLEERILKEQFTA